ncbi:S8 family serine peptidase [Kordia algicida OT-1]|uniref:Regulatory P domain of the subtilisin-like proprotein convertases and other protease n=1 Tax=Kordia algicida OT-1 TaxID=391587 RepID=A9DTA9_9FLAO|nr:S8 family serine peptidase [Kordia algicida]EDP97048.1 Regulatory P domain of the subtilisin-like proprotein convertases and other protease [Kordia algicida OT-1]
MKKKYLSLGLLAFGMFFAQTSFGQTDAEKQKIVSQYDVQALEALQNKFTAAQAQEKQNAIRLARQNGWDIRKTLADGTLIEIQKVTPDGTPIYYTTFNVDAARSTRTNFLNSGGGLGLNLMGQNMTAHVWDGGVARATHQEYDGAGGNNRFSTGDSGALNYHSAHVTGTIMASGVVADAKGMAPHASAVGYDWNSDLAEATSEASSGMLVSNHSYGFRGDLVPDYYFGAYITESRDWDEIMFNAPNFLMVVAAGNDGNQNGYNGSPLAGNSSYDKLTGHSTSKNNLVVANAQDASIDGSGNLVSVSINSSSSEGPTDDYRIKPDITGNGTGVYSTYQNSDTAYNSITGTSMASPNVAGSVLLLQQHYNNTNGSFARAATIKGIVLHTADDAGSNGPDAVFGWGLMNAKRAAEAISNNGNESRIEQLTLTSGQSYTITVDSDGVNPLLASISWTDRAGTATTATNSSTAVLVNDLDIRVTKGGTTYNPWRLTGVTTNGKGDNTVDPYERVDVSGASGTYTITVTHKGSLVGGSQDFSLIVTGLTGTPVVCNATTPTGVATSGVTDAEATVSWTAVPSATYDVRYRQVGTSTWITNPVSGTSTTLTGLSATTQYEVQVRSKCTSGNSSYSASINFTTTEFQLNYCASNGNSVADEYISRVQLATLDNSSGAATGGYADFTSESTSLTKNQTYTITVTPTWTGTTYSEGYSVWIDYNQDGDFTDAGEQVWTQAATQTTPVSGSFTVPTSATNGATRMRVSMKYNGVPTSCESFSYGEVEDYTVNISAGVADTVAPVITLNGAATINLTVGDSFTDPGATATDNVDGNLTSSIVVTGSVNTSVEGTYTLNYNVSDAAGNAATQVSRTVNVNAASSGSCAGQVSSFPYSEGFENTLGAWTQSTADDINWTVDASGTPSSNTGPSSATEGSYYIFVEASGNGTGYPTKQAILNSPCFDLSGETQATFAFGYHMYGAADMGSISVEASDDDGATWTSLWSETGNKGNSWQTASIDLAAYVGGTVQLRFNRITGATWQADIAIDDVSLTTSGGSGPSCSNVSLSITFDNYPEETSWEITNSGGTVVASGGTYGSQADGSTLNIDVGCLDDGCYDFTITDTYGDGICCTYGNGSFTLTNDDTGATLASGGSFTSSDTTNFCLTGTTTTSTDYYVTTNDDTLLSSFEIQIYPNPVKGDRLNVRTMQDNASYAIVNMMGQEVAKGKIVSGTVNVSTLRAGVYMIQVQAGSKTVTKKFVKQ